MYSNILIPVAFDGDHPTKAATEIARHMAAPGCKITFLHVMEVAPAYAINYMPVGYEEESRIAIKEALAEMTEGLAGATGVVVSGHGGRTIVDWSEEHGVDLIVIASHRPGISDYFLGSTAARVVRHAPCSVHVLR